MKERKAILLFDGVCNLCNGTVNFILKRDKKKQFAFVSLQSDEGRALVSEFNIAAETDSVILIHQNKAFTHSEAVLEICKLLPAPWKWVAVFSFIPKNLRDGIYRWIANNRYSWFGKRNTCRVI